MTLTEELLARLAEKICGSTIVTYGEHKLDFGHIQRLSMREAIGQNWPAGAGPAPSPEDLARTGGPRAAAERYDVWLNAQKPGVMPATGGAGLTDGELTGLLFEIIAEPKADSAADFAVRLPHRHFASC